MARHIITALSLVPAVLVAAMWARSYWRHDAADRRSADSYLGFGSISGWLYVAHSPAWVNDLRDNPLPLSDWAVRSEPAEGSWAPILEDQGWFVSNLFGTHARCPYWLALIAASTPPAWLSWHRHRRRRALRDAGKCVACGYDLRGTPGRCPECGAAERQAR